MKAMDFVKGYSHIGVPTTDMDATIKFYEDLGFELIYSTVNNGDKVCFLEKGAVQIETYEVEKSAMAYGALDHLALKVEDVDACYEVAKNLPYPVVEGPANLPFWDEKGVRYFVMEGPNKEKVEFIQKL